MNPERRATNNARPGTRDPRLLNLGILAHVDAGKTTLTERLLYETGVIAVMGSVDRGDTQTDTLALERQRGITIKSAVASFALGETTVNLIDTPGHPDFIAEVERVLSVLDGVILVISAVEGVQPQTKVLMRALQRLHIPTLLFINKIDRAGADCERVLASIRERLTGAIVPMGSAIEQGTRAARVEPFAPADDRFIAASIEALAEHDDGLLTAYLEGEAIPEARLRCLLAEQTGQALVHPVFCGSAITGAGIHALMSGIETLLPAAGGDGAGQLSGTVFKVERGPGGEKIAYVRLFSGMVRTRDTLRFGGDREDKVTAVSVFDRGPATRSAAVCAGQIGKLWGLAAVRIGDTIGQAPPERHRSGAGTFAPPTLETAIVPLQPGDKAALHRALTQIAEGDLLIGVRQDDRRGEMYVSLYGEVQKEVLAATLALEYGLEVHFRETSVICVERPAGTGEAVDHLGEGDNPFLATVGLRVEPGLEGSGLMFRLDVALVSVPLYVFKSVDEFRETMEETVRTTLQQGLHGWRVIDCVVTMTASGYVAPATQARDFRLLTPLVLMAALREAGTAVHEPIERFRLEIPEDSFGAAMPLLVRLGAVLRSTTVRGSVSVLEGEIRAARVQELRQQVPGATRGEGAPETEFAGYAPVDEPVPTRPRTDANPLNRKEYLLHVVRRV